MAIEVFNNIGETEISENPRFFKRTRQDDNMFDEASEKIESFKPVSKAKKEFLEHLEDDSLTIDKCNGLNFDWKKK